MPEYKAPVRDTRFIINEVLKLDQFADLPGFDMATPDMVDAILEEAGKFCSEVVAPLNQTGDREGCTRHDDGSVTTPSGFKDAYAQFQASGWGTLAMPAEYGGQGLPHVLHGAFEEFLAASNLAFQMYPGIAIGSVSCIEGNASQELKDLYLPRLVSGEWLGTMALTEPHCGTDLGLLRTRAEPLDDGSYTLTGTKMFISGGEHDLTENIVHLVLARLPDAPEGSRGISLFLVPKFLVEEDGSLGERNPAYCGSIEEKMGIHGNATCVMNFDGAKGWLVGQPHAGLLAMFIMMNAARLSVGAQSVGIADNASQNAAAYACERIQGRAAGERPDATAPADPLIVHPDVRRLLMETRCFTEGMRALLLWGSLQVDLAHKAEDEAQRKEADAMVSLLTPVIKGFGSDRGFKAAVDMQQIFGGHGYIEEYGMEQFVRDARVPMLYEGANGVQALDLAGRKVARDGGAVATRFFEMISSECEASPEALSFISDPLGKAVHHGEAAVAALLGNAKEDPNALGAGSYAFMELMGTLALGLMWLRQAQAASAGLESGEGDTAFYRAKLTTARFYAENFLPQATALRHRVKAGAAATMELPAELFMSGD